MIHDEPGAPLTGYKGPSPLQEHTQAEAGRSQKLEVNESPNEPSAESARLKLPALQYSKALANYRHVALIEIAKWSLLRAAVYPAMDEFPRVTSLLHSHLRYTG